MEPLTLRWTMTTNDHHRSSGGDVSPEKKEFLLRICSQAAATGDVIFVVQDIKTNRVHRDVAKQLRS